MPENIYPAFKQKNIPVVLSSDEKYASYLGVCIKSLVDNTSPEYNYDICILDGGIKNYKKQLIKKMQQSNVSIRFIDINTILKNYDSTIFKTTLHFTIAAYFRFFLPIIFSHYKKICYIDCDTILLEDISNLWKIDIGNNILGAIRDFFVIYNGNKNPETIKYYTNVLKMKNYQNYFNSGCMLCNIKLMRKYDLTQKLIALLKEIKTPKYVDQCILNSLCEGKVKFLPANWNYTWHIKINHPDYYNYIPKNLLTSFQKAMEKPYMMHFTSPRKPWNEPQIEYSYLFWKYARQTPFYEEILYKNFNHTFIDTSLIKDAFHYTKNKIRYWRYKLLSKITLGNMRKHYKQKKKELKERIRQVRRFLKEK